MESNDTANAVDQTTVNTVEATQELTSLDLSNVDGVNTRLLNESKSFKERALVNEKFKDRAFKAERELEAVKKAALTEQGKYKELYENITQELEQERKSIVREKVSSSLQSEAAKLGCVATDAVIKLVNSELLQWDKDTGTLHGAELALAEVKQKYPMLFQKQATSVINPSTPNGVDREKKVSVADIAKLPHNQKMDVWKHAFGAMKKN